MDKIKFFRRRQFTLGPQHIDYKGWHRYSVAGKYCLSVHPDLPFKQVSDKNTYIILLGYLIDPRQYKLEEEDILKGILQNNDNMHDIIECFEIMSGRFIIILGLHDKLYIFHDACGLRAVVYCRDKDGTTWCASQAESLAEILELPADPEVVDFRNSPIFPTGISELWLPNDRTPFRDILQLLPNHYLDLETGKSIRFWPSTQSIPDLSVEEGVRLSVPILKNSIHAACNRFDLKMGMSAGSDSRKTLSATKEVKDKLIYFTHAHKSDFADMKIPSKLLPQLGIPHYPLEQKVMNDEFRKYFEASATFARSNKGNIAYTIFFYLGSEANVLNSNVSEITQCNYWLPKSQINGEGLAIITGLYHPMAIKEFDKWLQDANEACESSGLNILTLFHWEQRGGRWAAASFSEYDIVHDSFTPYNNRYLNKILLGISERYRRDRMQYVSIKIIQHMWPEVLSEPINPPENLNERIREFIRYQILHKFVTPWFPIYEYVKYMRKRIRSKNIVTVHQPTRN